MPERTPPIELLGPLGPCPVRDATPTFTWRTLVTRSQPVRTATPTRRPAAAGRWRVRVWALPSGAKPALVMRRRPLLEETVAGDRTALPYPKPAKPLAEGAAYLWRVEAIDSRNRVVARSEPGVFYVADPALPFPLQQLLCCDEHRRGGGADAWLPAYGSPKIDPKEPACLGAAGTISLSGSWAGGDAASQQLPPGDAIEAGKHYVVSFCARARGRTGSYARFRVSAHNGSLPTSGDHPAPSAAVAPIGDSGRITTKEWTWVVLPPWQAPRDFGRIAIAAISDSDHVGASGPVVVRGDVANVCIQEVDGCDGLFAAPGAGPGIDFGRSARIDSAGPPPSAQLVAASHGRLVDLFGWPFDDDGVSTWYRAGDGCVSLGGWVPEDLAAHIPWLDEADLPPPPEVIEQIVQKVLDELKDPEIRGVLDPIPLDPEPCDDWDPAPHPQEPRRDVHKDPPPPFAGRDIVYVHGFVPNHVIARLIAEDPIFRAIYDTIPGASGLIPAELVETVPKEWPAEPEPYEAAVGDGEDGYFRVAAETGYWAQHIEKYLTTPGHPNRHMVAAYNCSQRLVFAVHAVLSQIAAAMSTGRGVRSPDDRTDCFGVEYVIVSHSTGALVTNVAMAVAQRTATDPDLQEVYGNISAIAKRAQAHVSMHGAISGSEGAQAGVAGAALVGGLGVSIDATTDAVITGTRLLVSGLTVDDQTAATADSFFTALTAVDTAVAAMVATIPRVVFASIMVDLSPLVTKTVWRDLLASSPVPTLMIASGHPSFGGMQGVPYVLKAVLPGLDDGVVSANSQAGSNALLHPDVYVYVPPDARVFDMGLPLVRSAAYFWEQVRGSTAAYAATPWLSPTGMVQPVMVAAPVPRYPNHYVLVQTASEHSYTTDGAAEDYLASFGAGNYEDSFVADSPEIFDQDLVHPSIVELMQRFERRLDLTVCLRIRIPRITVFPPSFRLVTLTTCVTFPLWRRFYDLLTTTGPVTSVANVAVTAGPTNVTVTGSVPQPDPVAAAVSGANAVGECTYAYLYVLPF